MSTLPDNLRKKLEKVAEIVDAEKRLDFFGVVRRDSLPFERWDVIVSARRLIPWSTDAITYVAGLLRRNLTDREIINIAQVVALPRNNELIKSLGEDARTPSQRIRGLHPMDHFDEVEVIWSAKDSSQEASRV
jgi:hypothetical protein